MSRGSRRVGVVGRVVVLGVILAFCIALFSGLVGVPTAGEASLGTSGGGSAHTLALLLLVGLAQAAVVAYLILRVRRTGWGLVGVVFLAFFGLNTVVNQVESLVYLSDRLPPGAVPRLVIAGALVAAVFSVVAVTLLGKMRTSLIGPPELPRPARSVSQWVWRAAASAGIYVAVYFVFGYYVAWVNPAVRDFYGGGQAEGFLVHLAGLWVSSPWIYPFEALRGLLWIAFSLPLISLHPGRRAEVGLATALLFSVWSLQLLLPNPYMPEAVARVHLVELAASNFIFGAVVGFLLGRPQFLPSKAPVRTFTWSGL
ncbi:MAG: hypothetical protein ACPLRW_04920 [Moorellales bacterium]